MCSSDLHFIESLEAVKEQNGGKSVQVVAHSMGGLVAYAALGQRPDLFRCLVLAGVPLHGGIGFLEDLHSGKKEGLNSHILSPNVLATFPSVYSFFGLDDNRLVEADGRRIDADMFEQTEWSRLAIGQFGQPHPIPKSEFEPFFKTALSQAKEFRKKLNFTSDSYVIGSTPKIHIVASKSHDTLLNVVRDGPRAV